MKPKSALNRYLDARFLDLSAGCGEVSQGSDEFCAEAIQGMQVAILDALKSGCRLPDDMRSHLVFAFENTVAGFQDELLAPVKRPGGRERPIAKITQEDAIRYLRWCEDGSSSFRVEGDVVISPGPMRRDWQADA